MQVNRLMNRANAVSMLECVRILRLSQVNNYCVRNESFQHNNQQELRLAAHSNSVHCGLLSQCANIHILTLTFRSPYWIVSGDPTQYRGDSIDDFLKDFDLQVVVALKHLRKVTIVGVTWHTIATNGISGFTYLDGLVKMATELKDALIKQKSGAEVRLLLECFEETEERVL
jgi:hypothetical protein